MSYKAVCHGVKITFFNNQFIKLAFTYVVAHHLLTLKNLARGQT